MLNPIQQTLPLFEGIGGFESRNGFGSKSRLRSINCPENDCSISDLTVCAGLTEIVLSHTSSATHPYHRVLPMLSQLSQAHSQRWFTWIAPTYLSKQALKAFGFNLECIQIIQAHHTKDALSLFRKALDSGTSATVVAECGLLTEDAFICLESAANKGQTQGFLLRLR